jgi:hypothetical protein
MNRALFVIAGIVTLLLAITYRTPLSWRYKPAPDYCEKQKRQIPDREKIENALMFSDNSRHYQSDHLNSFELRFMAANPKANKQTMVRAYLGQYPKCCKVVDPVFIRDKDKNYDGYDYQSEYRDTEYGYTKDVVIHKRQPFFKIENSRPSGENQRDFMFFNCGEVKEIFRG